MESTASNIEPESTVLNDSTGEQPITHVQVSIAGGLYLLIVTTGAMLRFSSLNTSPLSPAEAARALAAWQFLRPDLTVAAIDSPAYTTFTSILATFLGSSDVVMRLVPAIFGVGLIILPWLLRDRIGQIGTLIAALLLAFSPLLAAASRTAGGESIALFALLLIIIAGLKMDGEQSRRWIYVLAIALGIGLASAPLFYSGLLALAIARWAQQAVASDKSEAPKPSREQLIKAAGLALFTLVLISTRLFTSPAGFGAALQLFGNWISQFNLQGGLGLIIQPFLSIGRYELLLVIVGIIAIFWAIWRSQPVGTLFTYWLLTILVFIMLQRGVMENILLVSLSGSILLGIVTNSLLEPLESPWIWIILGIVFFLGAVILVNGARFLRVPGDQQLIHLWVSFLAIAAAALAFYYFWTDHDRAIIQGIWLGLILLLAIYQWGTAWHLTHAGAGDPRERWVQQATDDDLPVLVTTIEKISQQATNSTNDIQIFSAVDSPALRWYLRDFDQAQFGQALPHDAQNEVIITRGDMIEPAFGSDYLGGDFGLLVSGTDPEQLSSTPITDTIRWWLFHESAAPVNQERIILWVRSDLAYND